MSFTVSAAGAWCKKMSKSAMKGECNVTRVNTIHYNCEYFHN